MNRRARSLHGRLAGFRLGAVLAVAIGVAFVVWLLVRGGDDNKATTTTTTTTGSSSVGPVAASQARLRALSGELGHPVYWAGPKSKTTYELTRTPNGRVFIRYLPRGVRLGNPTAAFTIVGTYPMSNALKVLHQLAKKPGQKTLAAPNDGFAVYDRSHPTNVYLAYPGSDLQIEVFDPSPKRARRLITSGQVTPVR